MSQIEHPIARALRVRTHYIDKTVGYKIVVPQCPYCKRAHAHGCINWKSDENGHRQSHCVGQSPNSGYIIKVVGWQIERQLPSGKCKVKESGYYDTN